MLGLGQSGERAQACIRAFVSGDLLSGTAQLRELATRDPQRWPQVKAVVERFALLGTREPAAQPSPIPPGPDLALERLGWSAELRLALASLDGTRLLQAKAELERLDPSGTDWTTEAARAWVDWWTAGWVPVEQARALQLHGRRAKLPTLVVEGATLEALASLWPAFDKPTQQDPDGCKFDEAVQNARLASRQAATEAIPYLEVLTTLTLGAARRFAGQEHRALRVLNALEEVCPTIWRPWLDLERAWLGAHSVGGPATHLSKAVAALEAGATDDAHTQLTHLRQRAGGGYFVAHLRRFEVLMGLVSPTPGSTEELWAHGDKEVVPGGFTHILGSSEELPSVAAFVLSAPETSSRRVLRPAASGQSSALVPRSSERVSIALATLALAGPAGQAIDDFVLRVYGFAWDSDLHHGALDTLIYRMRQVLGERATVDRDEERLTLLPHELLVIADPRSGPSTQERVLAALAASPGSNVADVAELLGVPRRSVQRAIEALIRDDACHAQKQGRRVEYLVEDTSFTSPSLR